MDTEAVEARYQAARRRAVLTIGAMLGLAFIACMVLQALSRNPATGVIEAPRGAAVRRRSSPLAVAPSMPVAPGPPVALAPATAAQASTPSMIAARSKEPDARGAVFGLEAKGTDAAGHKRIVYVLDTSGSMEDKIQRAKAQLVQALSELQPGDTFNLVEFDDSARLYSRTMVPATPATVQAAARYVWQIELGEMTNMGAGLEYAFSGDSITHVFLLSDGQPTVGITDDGVLLRSVHFWNRQRAKILTIALGGSSWFDEDNVPLLQALAEDSGGEFTQVTVQ